MFKNVENFKAGGGSSGRSSVPGVRPRPPVYGGGPPVFIYGGVRYSSAAERDRAAENYRIRNACKDASCNRYKECIAYKEQHCRSSSSSQTPPSTEGFTSTPAPSSASGPTPNPVVTCQTDDSTTSSPLTCQTNCESLLTDGASVQYCTRSSTSGSGGKKSGLSAGAIAGIVIGSLVVIIIILKLLTSRR